VRSAVEQAFARNESLKIKWTKTLPNNRNLISKIKELACKRSREYSGFIKMHLVELSRAEHSELKIDPDLAEASAAIGQHLIPIVARRISQSSDTISHRLRKNPETGRFGAFVLMGLEPEENLFWSGTKLDVAYVPLNIRRRPFFVGTARHVEQRERQRSVHRY